LRGNPDLLDLVVKSLGLTAKSGIITPPGADAVELTGGVAVGAALPLADGEEDLRTCWVDYEQGQRHKPWKSVVAEGSTQRYGDTELEEHPQALHVAKMMLRTGGSPRGWLREWSREKGILKPSHVHHELTSLVDAFEYAGCVDQLNIGASACIECLVRRVLAIVEAYDRPDQQNWQLAAELAPSQEAGGLMTADLRAAATRKARDKMELERFRNTARLAVGPREFEPGAAASVSDYVAVGGLPPPTVSAPAVIAKYPRGSRGRGARPTGAPST
jgi:hypothetical protein